MVSVAIPELALKFSDAIAANFAALTTAHHQISTLFRSDSGVSVISFILYSAGTFLAIAVPAWILLHTNKKKKIDKYFVPPIDFEVEVPDGLILEPIAEDAFYRGSKYEAITFAEAEYREQFTAADAKYAEEIQLQESLLASILTSTIANNPSTSIQQPIPEISSQTFYCEICLENKHTWEMFENNKCSHSFCYECTISHITSKIQEKVKFPLCPAPNCKTPLNFDSCRLILPENALVKWDELLCLSLIPESQKLYCPFRDCSAMLVNDSGQIFKQIECLECRRSFCAECLVPWHSEFTCKEFQKVYGKKGKKNDEKIVKTLAKKKKWQKCPKCKMYVEKSEGCVHIVCRCKYEFCYRCGGKWTDSHGNCRPKP